VARRSCGPAFRNAQQRCDADVGAALGHRREDITFARRQRSQRIAGSVANHQLGHDLGIERRPASSNATQGVHELRDVAHPVLQQVADAAGTIGEELGCVLALDVLT
jgi:hypothetical protein